MEIYSLKGLKDDFGRHVTQACFREIVQASPTLYMCCTSSWGAINNHGKCIIPFEYASITSAYKNLLSVKSKDTGLYSIADGNIGKFLTAFEYTAVKHLSGVEEAEKGEHFFLTCINNLYGFIYIRNNVLVKELKPQYNKVFTLSKGYSKVALSGKIGLVSEKAVEVIPPEYEEVQTVFRDSAFFESGYAIAKSSDKKHVFSKDGTIVSECISDVGMPCGNDNFEVYNLAGLVGVIDKHFNICIPTKYDKISAGYSIYMCKKENRLYLYDENFKKIVIRTEKGKFISNVIEHDEYLQCTITDSSDKKKQFIYSKEGKKLSGPFMLIGTQTEDGTCYGACINKTYALISKAGKVIAKFDDYLAPCIVDKKLTAYYVRIGGNLGILNSKGEFLKIK